jgi:hypothetical protein
LNLPSGAVESFGLFAASSDAAGQGRQAGHPVAVQAGSPIDPMKHLVVGRWPSPREGRPEDDCASPIIIIVQPRTFGLKFRQGF